MSVYVIAHSGYESQAWIVEAESEDEAVGKIVNEQGHAPIGEVLGTVEELLADDDVNRVA